MCAYADKVKESPQLSLIATTNNQEKFPNKIRSRFRTMHIGVPNQEKRHAALAYLLHDAGLEIDDAVIAWAAKKTSGLTYRDLQSIISQTYKNQYRDDALFLSESFAQTVNNNVISIWSYFNPNAYTKKQSLMIKSGSEVMLSLAGIAFFAYQIAKMDVNPIHG